MASLVAPWPNLNDVSLYRILPVRALASTFILIGMLHLSMTTWLHAMAARIGRYSYSIYLWHVTVLGITYRLFKPLTRSRKRHALAGRSRRDRRSGNPIRRADVPAHRMARHKNSRPNISI